MIDIVSSIPNHYVLRSDVDLANVGTSNSNKDSSGRWPNPSEKGPSGNTSDIQGETKGPSPYLQVVQNKSTARLEELLATIKGNTTSGWNQIDLIVNHFRENYVLGTERVATADYDDSIESFLDQKGGPSYLFATAATQMLRLAGYRTRLRSGFLVQQKDFDRIARQSIVDSSNLHMWPEICLDGINWIPVEPTPGYPIPCNTQTLWQWAKIQMVNGINWAIANPWISISSFCLVVFSTLYRKQIAVFVWWIFWKMTIIGMPAMRLRLTRQLLDLRFWAAGMPRPAFSPIRSWYSQIDPQGPAEFIAHWQEANFSKQPPRSGSSQIQNACKQAVALLTYRRIRNFANRQNCE